MTGFAAPRHAVWLLPLILAACGGGSDESPAPAPPTPPANRTPTAVAQPSTATAYSSQLITLNAAGSTDPDGTVTAYAWAQVSGPTVSLTTPATASSTFVAPPVSQRSSLVFRVTVTDNAGATSTADTTIAVDPAAVAYTLSLQNPRPFVVDDEATQIRRSDAQFQGQTVTPSSVTWASDLQGNLPGSSTTLTANLQAGTHALSATLDCGPLGTVRQTLSVRVLPRKGAISTFQSTPALGATRVIPIVLINYIPTRDGVAVDTAVVGPTGTSEWTSGTVATLLPWISTITTRSKFMLEEGSRFRGYKTPSAAPYIGYRVVEIYNYYEEMPPGYPDPAISGNTFPDYHAILARIPAQQLVENQGVREFWLYGYHYGRFSLNESNMASPTTGDISNSYRTAGDLPVFANTYIVYQNNYTRSQAEAVHNHGHQIEAMMAHVNQIRDGNTNLFWRQFVGLNASNVFAPGRCGATHFPLNATADYDYLNSTNVVQSDCEDWKPDGTGVKKASTLSTWADIPYAWPGTGTISQKAESQWYIYWLQNLPGAGNTIPYAATTMENWWELIGNWDASYLAGRKLYK